MKLTQPLNDLFGQQSKVKLLRYLVNSGAEMAGREIARSVGLTQRSAHQALMSLCRQGIVCMRRVGRAKLYALNKENLFVTEALIPLFAYEDGLPKRLTRLINQMIKGKIISAIMFGSLARGDERPDSDIDLLIILNNKTDVKRVESILDKLNALVSIRFGLFLAAIVMSCGQFRNRYNKKDKLVRNIAADGKVIYGKTIMEIIYD